MKRSGFVRSKYIADPIAYEIHETAVFFRWEVRLNRGAVHSFLLGWLIESSRGVMDFRLTPALGVGDPRDLYEGADDIELLIARAVDRWQKLRAAKLARVG